LFVSDTEYFIKTYVYHHSLYFQLARTNIRQEFSPKTIWLAPQPHPCSSTDSSLIDICQNFSSHTFTGDQSNDRSQPWL